MRRIIICVCLVFALLNSAFLEAQNKPEKQIMGQLGVFSSESSTDVFTFQGLDGAGAHISNLPFAHAIKNQQKN